MTTRRTLAALLTALALGACDEGAPCDDMQGCPASELSGPERAAQVREQQFQECIEAGGTGSSCTSATP